MNPSLTNGNLIRSMHLKQTRSTSRLIHNISIRNPTSLLLILEGLNLGFELDIYKPTLAYTKIDIEH